jgi:dual-specificity kinase
MSTPQTLTQILPPHQHLDHQRYLPAPQDRLLPPPRPSSNLSNSFNHNIPSRPSSNLSNRQLPPLRPESGMSNSAYSQPHSQPRSAAEHNYHTTLPYHQHIDENLSRANSTSSLQTRYLPPPTTSASRAPEQIPKPMPPAHSHDAKSSPHESETATARKRRPRGPVDWFAFYGGRPPAEIIEIHDDDSPAPPATVQRLPPMKTSSHNAHHVDKRRRIARGSNEAASHSTSDTTHSYSNANSAESYPTTAATSLTSTSSSSRHATAQIGQKRKRTGRQADADQSRQDYTDGLNAQGYLAEYGEYIPPPKQFRKQKEVYVPLVEEVW